MKPILPQSTRWMGRALRRAAPLSVALLLLAAFAFSASPLAAQAAKGRKIEVLFLGHLSQHHPSDQAASFLVPALAKDGINFSYSTDPNDLNPRELAKYDALLLYANHDTITKSQEKALLDFVNSGHGFIPIHSASWCFQNSPAYIAMVGGQFHTHKTGTFTADIVKPDHPVMKGLKPFETWDETYVHDHIAKDITVLMERVEGDHHEPWTWVRNQGKGRVFYTAYGHDERTWSQPAFQQLVKNGIVWAVSDAVRNQWAQLDIPEFKYVDSGQIPNYERRNPPLQLQLPLSPRESMQHIQVPPGFELQLFASEPDIVKPISMAWDERGRLWIAETIDYPNDIHPGQPGRDRIKILEDTNNDGKADKFTVFAENLNIPTGLVFANGGVIVSAMPNFLFLKDTDGDDKADVQQVLLGGWGFGDTHAGPSNLRYGFDNHIYGAVGYSSFRGLVNGDSLRFGQAIYRMERDGKNLEQVAAFSNNTWGLGFSETFDIFGSTANNTHAVYVGIPLRYVNDAKGLVPRFGSEKIDGHYAMAPITPNVRQVDVFGGFTAAAGFNLYTARAYPQEYWNRIALVSEPTGRLTHRAILEKKGAGFVEKDGWNLLASNDDWVGPVDAQVGPDGQVWVSDWYNFIIQHNPTPAGFENGKGNAYENPLRDHTRGRIYRVVYKGAPAYKPMSLSKDRPADLVKALTNDNLFWRLTAQRLLVERGNKDVAPQLIRLVNDRKVDGLGLNPGALHALWTLDGLGLLDGSNAQATAAAVAALKHPAAGVRKAAVQVLPTTPASVELIRSAGLLTDSDPHTRLAAILVLAEVPASDALGAELYAIGKTPAVDGDEWLSNAVYVAAAQHRAGYFKAYAADLGAGPFRALADRLAREETTPPAPPVRPAGGAAGGQRRGPPPPPPHVPVGERLLRAYVEDIVGPIQRPERGGQRFGNGASDEPVLEMQMSVVRGQMKFSVPDFTVKPGQRVRITFTNPDEMQHNMLIVRPGTVEAVGALADAQARTPDAAERGYVPPTPDVMWFSKLLDPGESTVLEFVAPRQEGDYPYLCTFPGHWRVMQGTMKVAP
jgi:putative membrane-bound dehydrogenase-like protein